MVTSDDDSPGDEEPAEPDEPLDPAAALGRAVALRRVELGLGRRALAEAAGLSYPYVAEIERGGRSPSTKALRALAGALSVTSAELLARADALASPGATTSTSISPTAPGGASSAELAQLVRRVVREEMALSGSGSVGEPDVAPPSDPSRLREVVLVAARQMLGNEELVFDDEGDIPIRRGEVMLFVRVLDDPLSVLVFSPVLAEVDESTDLMERLNDLNAGTHFVRHCYTHNGVVVDLEAVGESFRVAQLAPMCRAVSDAAETIGPVLQEEFGGRLFFGDETLPKPRRESLGYL